MHKVTKTVNVRMPERLKKSMGRWMKHGGQTASQQFRAFADELTRKIRPGGKWLLVPASEADAA